MPLNTRFNTPKFNTQGIAFCVSPHWSCLTHVQSQPGYEFDMPNAKESSPDSPKD
ncbi:hypothetical protein ACRTDL_03940 [Shewanella algae]|uniref:hypothetical protein n=1 Tax=Shewanella algae TaxID=38313 RepID=UPI0031F4B916